MHSRIRLNRRRNQSVSKRRRLKYHFEMKGTDMNAPTKINSATENLQEHKATINLLVTEEIALRLRIAAAIKVRREFNEARSNLENCKNVKREILGKIHLSGKAQTDMADKASLMQSDIALRDAQARVESLNDSAEGAAFALERLEIDATELHSEVNALRKQEPAMQLAAATMEAESIIERYVAAGDELESSLASVIGALQTLEFMRHSDKPLTVNGRAFYLWNELYPCALELPNIPFLQERFTAFRPHARVAELAAAQREHFTSHLNTLGII
jgi:hypothetical protein